MFWELDPFLSSGGEVSTQIGPLERITQALDEFLKSVLSFLKY
jgi:hypothetical protein